FVVYSVLWDLHSFPTRRSSDLVQAAWVVARNLWCRPVRDHRRREAETGRGACACPRSTGGSRRLRARRTNSDARARIHPLVAELDRKSTRLNSSHVAISYAVFC